MSIISKSSNLVFFLLYSDLKIGRFEGGVPMYHTLNSGNRVVSNYLDKTHTDKLMWYTYHFKAYLKKKDVFIHYKH